MRLTCKQKVERDSRGKELPSGIVKWYVEVFDTEDELVAIATILTMVQRKNTVFKEIDTTNVDGFLKKLQKDTQPAWGSMTAQHMVEHLAFSYDMAAGKIQDFEVATPEEHLEKLQESLYNYKPMPHDYKHPLLKKDGLESLTHENLEEAKGALLKRYGKL